MIRTVTLNSGFDEFFTVSNFEFGGVGDVIAHRTIPSGKGFNAARVVRMLGEKVKAYGLVGATDHDEFASRLEEEHLPASLISVPGRVRRNLTILNLTDHLPTAHLKGQGLTLESDAPLRALISQLADEIEPGDLITLNGSTPQGLADDAWAECGRMAIEKGARLLLDVSGEPLRIILRQSRVLVCKPNEEEMSVLSGNNGDRNDAVQRSLEMMASCGVTLPMVTLGKEGLRFLVDQQSWGARCDSPNAKVLVGAGDACVAGLAVGFARSVASLSEIACHGLAVATAYVNGTDPAVFGSEVERIRPSVELQLLQEAGV
jgi:1-phosphofructokinase family hexose kinase